MRFILLFLFSGLFVFGQTAYDVSIQQVNSAGDAYVEQVVPSTAYKLLGFGSDRVISPITIAAGTGTTIVNSNNTITISSTGGSGNVTAAGTLTSGSIILGDGTTAVIASNFSVTGNSIAGQGNVTLSAGSSGASVTLEEGTNGNIVTSGIAALVKPTVNTAANWWWSHENGGGGNDTMQMGYNVGRQGGLNAVPTEHSNYLGLESNFPFDGKNQMETYFAFGTPASPGPIKTYRPFFSRFVKEDSLIVGTVLAGERVDFTTSGTGSFDGETMATFSRPETSLYTDLFAAYNADGNAVFSFQRGGLSRINGGLVAVNGNAGAIGGTPSSTGVTLGYNYSNGDGEGNIFFGGTAGSQYLQWSSWNGSSKTDWMRLNASGQLSLLATTASTSLTTGTLVTGGGVGVSGALNAGWVTASANANVLGATPSANGVSLGYNYSGGDAESNLIFGGSIGTQYLQFSSWNGSAASNWMRLNANGQLSLLATTASTSLTTGTLVTAGGIAVTKQASVGWLTASGNSGSLGYVPSATGVSLGYNQSNGSAEANLVFGAGSISQWLEIGRWSGSALTGVARFYGTGGVTIGGTSDPGSGSLSLTGNLTVSGLGNSSVGGNITLAAGGASPITVSSANITAGGAGSLGLRGDTVTMSGAVQARVESENAIYLTTSSGQVVINSDVNTVNLTAGGGISLNGDVDLVSPYTLTLSSLSGILKGNGGSPVTVATVGTDYYGPSSSPHAVGTVILGAGGAAITTGIQYPQIKVPYGGTLQGWTVTAYPSGSITIDILRSANGAGLPASSIVGGSGTKPNTSSSTENSSTSFTSWTSTTITALDNILFQVTAADGTVTSATITLYYQ